MCPKGFDTCTTRLDDRLRYRKNLTDDVSPRYFAQTLDNEIKDARHRYQKGWT